MEALLLSLLAAVLVNASTYVAKIQKGEKFVWQKAFRTIVIGAVLGAVGASSDTAVAIDPSTYLAASAGITAVVDQGVKAGVRWVQNIMK